MSGEEDPERMSGEYNVGGSGVSFGGRIVSKKDDVEIAIFPSDALLVKASSGAIG